MYGQQARLYHVVPHLPLQAAALDEPISYAVAETDAIAGGESNH